MSGRSRPTLSAWTSMDFALLAVVAAVSGIIFYSAWFVYELSKIGGPIVSRTLTYGLWFIGAPLGASLIRKPLSAFLGETMGALVESLVPTIGGITNLYYGAAQGLLSELVYLARGYKRWDPLTAAMAGAAAAPAAVALDALLFSEIATPIVMLVWAVAAAVSGAVYGFIAAKIIESVRGVGGREA